MYAIVVMNVYCMHVKKIIYIYNYRVIHCRTEKRPRMYPLNVIVYKCITKAILG